MSRYGYKIIIGINVLALTAAAASFVLIRSAIAQTATSTEEVSETIDGSVASTTSPDIAAPAMALDLREVRIIGTKYTDYFTDGTTLFAFPGDPEIHANIGKPGAPAPAREGFVWDHSNGTYLYDTPSGDLEIGTFAKQPNDTFIAYLATTTIENATSTPFLPARIVVLHERPSTAPELPEVAAEQTPAETNVASASAASDVATTSSSASSQENQNSERTRLETGTTSVATDPEPPVQTQQEAGQVLGTTTEESLPPAIDVSAPEATSFPEAQ